MSELNKHNTIVKEQRNKTKQKQNPRGLIVQMYVRDFDLMKCKIWACDFP